jgi:ribosomal peptide maturation radical SAM protein 1
LPQPSSAKRVLLAVMPFTPLERPPLGPAILKRGLERRGITCELRYFHFRFADLIGFKLYQRLVTAVPTHDLTGEWLFTRALHGEAAPPAAAFERYAMASAPQCYDPGFFAQLEHCREIALRFIQECAEEIAAGGFDIVGFSSTFQQNLSSLSLARALKLREPQLHIVMGGANFEGEMGTELHRLFPWVDYVCSGESDETFPALVETIRAGREPRDVPGVTFRDQGISMPSASPPQLITEMDTLPIPDHSDFIDAYKKSTASLFIKPQLTMETSRGCWWGQKHHCTFCGLNGLGMRYRSKSVERAYQEIKELVLTYGINSFFNTDNILDLKYFTTLFPKLERDGLQVELYYETKSNLKKAQLLALKRIGTNWIQPGIESLSSHVLQLMNKGVSALQNLQVLKWASELRMTVTWNIICGFPGENAEDYEAMARMVPLISHLQPPASFARFRADRFSPVCNDPGRYGLKLRPYDSYSLCYPMADAHMEKLAYFFTYDSPLDPAVSSAIGSAWRAVESWRENSMQFTLAGLDSGEFLVILDRRLGREPRQHLLTGARRLIYRELDAAISTRKLLETLRRDYPWFEWNERELRTALDMFEHDGLTVCENDTHLALAVIAPERPLAQHVESARIEN